MPILAASHQQHSNTSATSGKHQACAGKVILALVFPSSTPSIHGNTIINIVHGAVTMTIANCHDFSMLLLWHKWIMSVTLVHHLYDIHWWSVWSPRSQTPHLVIWCDCGQRSATRVMWAGGGSGTGPINDINKEGAKAKDCLPPGFGFHLHSCKE